MKTREEQREIARQKRLNLSLLCKSLKKLVDMGILPEDTTNGLLRTYYASKGYKNLHTFNEWKKMGYNVNKGATALLVWGKPKKAKESEEKQDEETQENFEFYPVAYLFCSDQVTKKE